MKNTVCSALAASLVALLCSCGSPCTEGGSGTINLVIAGLPDGLATEVTLAGPNAATQSVTHNQMLSVASGPWTATAKKATQTDARVRTVYSPSIDEPTFCLPNGATQTVTVNFASVSTSNKVWFTNANGAGELLGFSSPNLATTGSVAASVAAHGSAGHDLTFDADGNLWSLGPTTADPQVTRFSAASFATSGAKTRDRSINIKDLSCLPALAGLALDTHGNVWVSSPCANKVFKLAAAGLEAGGTLTPASTVSGLQAPQGLAFDSAGNLWVADADATRVMRFDAATLSSANIDAANAKIGVRTSINPLDDSVYAPGWLAFDASGNLWGNDFGGNIIFRIDSADLTAAGDRNTQPAVRITLPVNALLEGLAFDEGGGLWTAYSAGKVARLGPGQLDTSTGAGSPTVPETIITSADVGNAVNVAIYPAPAGLPLTHRLP